MERNDYSISSVEKVFKLVEVMAEKNGELSVTQIAEKLDSSVSSVNRFLQTMERIGYVKKNVVTKKYFLTNKIFALTNKVLRNDTCVNTMLPMARLFANKYDIMVNVNSIHNKDAITMYVFPRYNIKEMDYQLGDSAPAYASGAGRSMLSLYSPKELDEYFKDIDLIKYQRNTLCSESAIRESLKEVRENGYASSVEEYTLGLYSLSFPVKTKTNTYYSITLITPLTEYKKVFNKTVIFEVKSIMQEKKKLFEG